MRQTSLTLPFASEALLFDLDDTLYDRDKAYACWARSFVREYFSAGDASQAQGMIDLLIKLDAHEDTPREALFSQFQQYYPSLTLPVATLVDGYYKEFPCFIEPLPEVNNLVSLLQAAGISFGIITNGSFRQLRKIEILGFHQLTSCIFVSHLFGKEKPDAAIFLAAAAHLQTRPEKILFVGDHPYNDIWGAHSAGMRTAWLQRAHHWPETLPQHIADMTLHSLSDLL